MRRDAARALLAVISVVVTAAGCAAGAPVPEVPTLARGVPGFDTRVYPGATALRAWRQASPYRWVGYYLPAPCYTGTTWVGRRAELERMGWGVAVLFVGEQDWANAGAAADTVHVHEPGARCTQTNLTEARGRADAMLADSTAAAEGFAPGTAIYLDVERVERVSPALEAYVRGWVTGLLEAGRYEPALYAHARNAEALYPLLVQAFAAHARLSRPRLWVAGGPGFDRTRAPAESPVPYATVWQGLFDVREEWGGVPLVIDVNVAESAAPSGR